MIEIRRGCRVGGKRRHRYRVRSGQIAVTCGFRVFPARSGFVPMIVEQRGPSVLVTLPWYRPETRTHKASAGHVTVRLTEDQWREAVHRWRAAITADGRGAQ